MLMQENCHVFPMFDPLSLYEVGAVPVGHVTRSYLLGKLHRLSVISATLDSSSLTDAYMRQ